jgi:hypothetical protein
VPTIRLQSICRNIPQIAAIGIVHVGIPAWSWYGSLTALSFTSGATISRARLIASSRLASDVATGIASAREMETSTDIRELVESG